MSARIIGAACPLVFLLALVVVLVLLARDDRRSAELPFERLAELAMWHDYQADPLSHPWRRARVREHQQSAALFRRMIGNRAATDPKRLTLIGTLPLDAPGRWCQRGLPLPRHRRHPRRHRTARRRDPDHRPARRHPPVGRRAHHRAEAPMSAPLQVRPATFPPVGFSTAPSGRAWSAACRPCGSNGVPMLIARSSVLDRAGWHACMTAAHAHITKHKEGGRL